MKKYLLVLAVIAASAHGFELQGYKSLSFGASIDQLRSLGFKCDKGERVYCQGGKDTLFGKESSVSAWARPDSGVTKIDVSIMGMSGTDLVRAYTEALGAPRAYVHPNMFHQRIEASYWVSADGTAIVVKRNLDEGETRRLPGFGTEVRLSSATYLDKRETESLLTEAQKYAPKPRDY